MNADKNVLDKVVEILSPILIDVDFHEIDDIVNLGIDDLPGWDSFAHFQIVIALETSLGIKLNSEEIFDIKTISNVISIVSDAM